jgi:hypothetical protein
MGKLFTARAFIGVIGGLRNLPIELLEVTTRNGILLYFGVTSILPCQRHGFQALLSSEGQILDSRVIKGIATTRAPDFLNAPKVGRIQADSYKRYNGRDDL